MIINTFPHSGNGYKVTVCFETRTEAEALPPGVVFAHFDAAGMCVWSKFVWKRSQRKKRFQAESSGVSFGHRFFQIWTFWGQTVPIYTFPNNGNVHMVTVSFQTFTEAETFPPGVVGRVVWVPFL